MTNHLFPITPSPSPTQRHDGWTPERRRKFCETLAECGQVSVAARAVGMDMSSAYRLRRRADAREFAVAWEAALCLAQQMLVDEAMALAFEGSHDIVMRDGEIVAERRRRDSRTILTTLAKLKDCGALQSPEAHIVAQDFDSFLDRVDGSGDAEAPPLPDYFAAKSGKRITPPRNNMGRFLPAHER
jgi:hypothetical protein